MWVGVVTVLTFFVIVVVILGGALATCSWQISSMRRIQVLAIVENRTIKRLLIF